MPERILKNAVSSIQIGVEDCNSEDERRYLSAVRNIYAGVLLLFKYKLAKLSPDGSDLVLLKTDIRPRITSAGLEFVGYGRRTIDHREIENRIKALGHDNIDWKKLEKLQKIRNNLEHFYVSEPIKSINEAIANALHVITGFSKTYLNKSPADLLGQECWEAMLQNQQLYEKQLQECRDTLNKVNWPHQEIRDAIPAMHCDQCGSELVEAQGEKAPTFSCRACQADLEYDDVVTNALHESLEINLRAFRHGEQDRFVDCPECGNETYYIPKGICFICDFSTQGKECAICGVPLSLENVYDGVDICDYHTHLMQKDD